MELKQSEREEKDCNWQVCRCKNCSFDVYASLSNKSGIVVVNYDIPQLSVEETLKTWKNENSTKLMWSDLYNVILKQSDEIGLFY